MSDFLTPIAASSWKREQSEGDFPPRPRTFYAFCMVDISTKSQSGLTKRSMYKIEFHCSLQEDFCEPIKIPKHTLFAPRFPIAKPGAEALAKNRVNSVESYGFIFILPQHRLWRSQWINRLDYFTIAHLHQIRRSTHNDEVTCFPSCTHG